MKRLIYAGLSMLVLIAFSCEKEATNDPFTADSKADDLVVAEVKTTSKQTVDIIDVVNSVVAGSSTLHRNANGVTVNFKAEGLIPGHAYTIWWIVWNYPDECAGVPCGFVDFFNPDVDVDVLYAAGNVVGNSGKGNFSAHLSEGNTSGDTSAFFGLPPATGLVDAQNSEIHVVLRSHGPKIPGLVNEQIGSYEGGCIDFFAPFSAIPLLEGECGDIYASVHIAD